MLSSRSSGPDRVAAGAEPMGTLFTAGSRERIDRVCELHVYQTSSSNHRIPPCTRQGSGNSTGPQVDVFERVGGHGLLDAHVGDRHATAGFEHVVDLPVDT